MNAMSKTVLATACLLAMSIAGAQAADTKTGQQSSTPPQSQSTTIDKTYPSQSAGGSSSSSSYGSGSGGGSWARKAD